LAEEKSTPVKKTVEAKKEAAKAPAPDTETKPATEKKTEEKQVPKKGAPEPAPAKKAPASEPKAPAKKKAVAKKKNVEEPKTEAVEKKPEAKEEVKPKVVKPVHKEWAGNPMLMPVIEKVTVNMSVGKSGAPLEQAVTIITQLTNQKPSKRKAKKTVREFGIRKGENIACLVTLRAEKAEEFLKKAFYAVENKLSKYSFDGQGNFSFGIKEHINIPGTKYLPELGIHGMDVSVSLGRAGYRVKRRHRGRTKIGKDHLLTAKEAILFIKDEFDVEIM
jgi:large subunit ribosomal protein L5